MAINLTNFKLSLPLVQWLIDHGHATGDEDPDQLKQTAFQLMTDGVLTADHIRSLKGNQPMTAIPAIPSARVFNPNPRKQSAKFCETKSVGTHSKTGAQVLNPFTGRPTELQSQKAAAKAGVLFRHLANRAGLGVNLEEWEKDLLTEYAHEPWAGKYGGDEYDLIQDGPRVKALLDDGTSGGLEITPIEFDSDVISFPLLTGELFPRVDVRNVSRGRRIEGASIQTPTGSWGGADGSEIGLFNTANLVAAIDTTIHVFNLAIEIGRDFLSDSPVNVGTMLTALIGERMSAELDDVIASGDGSTQPEGILNASGVTVATTDNGGGGPPTLNDYTELMFAVGKQYRNASMGCAYLSNDTTFQRSRAIRVDPQTSTTDQRPVLTGGDTTSFNNYMTLGWGHAIQNDIGNATAVFGALRKYRMYRRLGLEIRFEQGGATLARKNLVLLIARARFGGQVVDASAFAKWTTGQT